MWQRSFAAIAPQGRGMAVDPMSGGDFQILLSGGRSQDQPAVQGHLLGCSMRGLPFDELGLIRGR
jgi:hypothetical protein